MRTPLLHQCLGVTLSVSLVTSSALLAKPKRAPADPAPVAAIATPAPPASATTAMKPLSETLTGSAKTDYDAAKILYQDGDYSGASLKFKQSYEASKDVRLLWNMAACEKSQRHYAKVQKLVERYLALGNSMLPDSDRKDAESLLEAMKAFVSRVKISVAEPEASVFVDDEKVGESPLMEAALVDMGSHRIRVTKAGFAEFSQTVELSGASEVPVVVKLVKETHEARISVAAAATNLVYVDGKVVGEGRWEGAVSSGAHTIRVTGAGMRPYQTEVALGDRETRSIQVTLEAEAKKEESSHALLWILGGVALVGAATAGGIAYFSSKASDSSGGGQGPIAGTIQPGSVQLSFGRATP